MNDGSFAHKYGRKMKIKKCFGSACGGSSCLSTIGGVCVCVCVFVVRMDYFTYYKECIGISLAILWPQKWPRVDTDSRLCRTIGLLGIKLKWGVLSLSHFKSTAEGSMNQIYCRPMCAHHPLCFIGLDRSNYRVKSARSLATNLT